MLDPLGPRWYDNIVLGLGGFPEALFKYTISLVCNPTGSGLTHGGLLIRRRGSSLVCNPTGSGLTSEGFL